MIVNCHKGETAIEINGRNYLLRLTLGGLAQIESGFAIADFKELGERFKNLKANDLILLLAILLEGGRNPLSLDEIRGAEINLSDAAGAIARCFTLNFEK